MGCNCAAYAGVIGWEEYTLVHEGTMLNKLSTREFPLSYHIGILGFSGLTAYGGFYNLCKPKNWEKVFVAFGSLGMWLDNMQSYLGAM
ncbi:hypothetical protein Syun_025887 [Stephania yunnanensis]|uniref:Uncharacterized protein n=1 Tax=Stephania yunnanensis TaxID=152371 RepID=A0AAP0EVF0_9MAGN